jgi:hypothetical protein
MCVAIKLCLGAWVVLDVYCLFLAPKVCFYVSLRSACGGYWFMKLWYRVDGTDMCY